MNIPTHLLLQAIAGLQHPAIGYEQTKTVVVKDSYHERVTLRFEWLDDVNGWALVEIQEETNDKCDGYDWYRNKALEIESNKK